ncbi:MAG: triple tyrosine motif-containing protein [Bacteroidota bacterium]
MIKIKVCFVFLFLFSCVSGKAQNDNLGVISFTQNDYQGARQNWSISTAGNGVLYFANRSGLLVFDGTNWKLNKQFNQTTMRSVKVKSDSIIYTGGYMEFGYWKKDQYGNFSYHSLNPKASDFIKVNSEFWDIEIKDDYVYFRSYAQILSYHNDSVVPVELDGYYPVMNTVNDKILVVVQDSGIFEIKQNKAVPFIKDNFFLGKQIKFIIPFINEQVLIGTREHGIFLWDDEKIKVWNSEWTDYFIKNELNRAYLTAENKVIIGTLIDGIVVFDEFGRLESKVNTRNGLLNNTVLGITTDEWQNIWLALDVGIGFVSCNSNRNFTVYKFPIAGAIYSTAIFENKLYLGTNQGLFEKSLDQNDSEIRLVPETQDQIWELKVIDNQLLVGHNHGTFAISKGACKKISKETGGFNFVDDPLNPELIIQSTYNNLVVFIKTAEGVEYKNSIKGFANLIRYIEFDHLGNLWASHLYHGVYKIKLDDQRLRVPEGGVTYYGSDIFGKEDHVHVFKVENRIVFTTGKQIFTYDDIHDSIVEYSKLNEGLGKYKRSHRIIGAPNHHYWFIGKDFIALFSIVMDKVELIREYPTSLFNNMLLVEDFENLLPLSGSRAILCFQNGIAFLDADISYPTVNLINNYTPILRHIELSNNKDVKKILPLNSSDLEIKHAFNNLKLQFSYPLLNDLPIYYQYKLEGLDSEWSGKTKKPLFNLVRLPQGKYTMKVKAVDSWGNESKIYSYPFKVLPPTTASCLAILFYILLLISSFWLFRSRVIRQIRKKEKIEHDKREKELIRLRNEKLRDEVRFKSKELANSTMAIIKKNEFLLNLKKSIETQKVDLGSRYPDKYYNHLIKKIDNNISNQDDWQVFETNFERAYEQFFVKMKTAYPELTSRDLRLAAYLKMNLSSKEIAPLLGISVRGVENHRYKLRKRLKLKHNDSLTDVILSI